ncbi:MAG: hypothetical protein ACM3MB_08940 [Acidobacteriota bacterium]
MKNRTVRLYVNDSIGKRWEQNIGAARLAAAESGAGLTIIKKTSNEYLMEKDPPPCPSAALDNAFLVTNGTVTYEELRAALAAGR